MTKRIFASFILLALGGTLLLGFQNCAPMAADPGVSATVGSSSVWQTASAGDQATLNSTDSTTSSSCTSLSGLPLAARPSQTAGASIVGQTMVGTTTKILNGMYTIITLNSISDGTGSVSALGSGAGSKVNSLARVDGNVTLCNASLGSAGASSLGNISIANGSIDSIDGYTGNVFVSGGNVGPVSNFTGNLMVVNGTVGAVTNFKGKIIIKDSTGTHSRYYY